MEFELQQFGMTQRQKNALATLRIYGVDVDPSSSAENMIEIISKYPEIHNLPRDMPAISMEISTRWFRLQQKKDRLMELNASP
ncbi:MAG: hypothetical protein DME26_06885 [Verrucomicrobia bacterium]|nr:MAG: hypothetical protein DME26_06885 [Verrucomicrobiota bacterium]